MNGFFIVTIFKNFLLLRLALDRITKHMKYTYAKKICFFSNLVSELGVKEPNGVLVNKTSGFTYVNSIVYGIL